MQTIALILSSLSSIFTAFILYKLSVKEKIIKEPKILKPKKEIVIFKGNGTFGERFLDDLKNG